MTGGRAATMAPLLRLLTAGASGLLIGLITLYRGLSAVTPASCRFDPTCSAYAAEAIRLHGPVKGGRLAVRRIVRCHPWGGCGYDPVPARDDCAAGRAEARASGRPDESIHDRNAGECRRPVAHDPDLMDMS